MVDPYEGMRLLQEQENQRSNSRIEAELRTANHARAIEASKEQCPWCGGRIDRGYEICKHCGSALVWVNVEKLGFTFHSCCKSGEEEEGIERCHEAHHERVLQLEMAANKKSHDTKLMWVVIIIVVPLLLGFFYFIWNEMNSLGPH